VTFEVVYEDNHLLAVVKPAGLLVQGDQTGDVTLLDLARDYRKRKENKPGNVFVGLVHRLDRPVSGLVLLAKTSKGASRLSEQFRSREVRKLYLAVCQTKPGARFAVGQKYHWVDRLSRPGTVEEPSAGKIQLAQTNAEIRALGQGVLLAGLEPTTGRKHQLRAQAALHGLPILGDRRYGATRSFENGLALHALALAFKHPTRSEPMLVVAPPPRVWQSFGWDPSLFRPGDDFHLGLPES
jgi:23S rRNA pseudouridine1911/1915/1917 synthase